MAKKRKYTKKSDYWDKFNNNVKSLKTFLPEKGESDFVPHRVANHFDVASASRISNSGTGAVSNRANEIDLRVNGRFPFIESSGSPFLESEDGYSVQQAILLCQKAYYNFPIFMNAIDVMSEFTNTEHYLEDGSAQGRSFFKNWLASINIEGLKDQFFRERYRGGNIFLYRVEGKLDLKGVKTLLGVAPKPINKIPVKYTLLNAADIIADRSVNFSTPRYRQVLSKFDIDKLRNDTSPAGVAILNSLDPEVKSKIKKSEYSEDGISIKVDPKNVLMSFYKKQDYEPFAVPFGYRVLDDLNAKAELKKADQRISRTVQEAILLITMGESPKGGGIGVNNMAIEAMTELFETGENKGRVLVSDYTTEAQFIIPDLQKVVGPEKYQILNEDIKEGLQNIIIGKENYSSTQVKAEMFLERLRESRDAFVRDVIQPEIEKISKEMGFKKAPLFKFKNVDLKDESVTIRLVTRLLELGIFTPEQAMETIDSGIFPKAKSIKQGHKTYIEDRKDGYANPIVGGVPFVEGEDGTKDLNNNQGGNPSQQGEKNNTKKTPGRPIGEKSKSSSFKDDPYCGTLDEFKAVSENLSKLEDSAIKFAKEKFKIETLNTNQKELCKQLCFKLASAMPIAECEKKIKEYIDNPQKMLQLEPSKETQEISDSYEVSTEAATILYQLKK